MNLMSYNLFLIKFLESFMYVTFIVICFFLNNLLVKKNKKIFQFCVEKKNKLQEDIDKLEINNILIKKEIEELEDKIIFIEKLMHKNKVDQNQQISLTIFKLKKELENNLLEYESSLDNEKININFQKLYQKINSKILI